jgi:hypothetical protein
MPICGERVGKEFGTRIVENKMPLGVYQYCMAPRAQRVAVESKREHGRVLPRSEHVHKCLTHEEANGNANRDSYHGTPNVNPVARRSDCPSISLRETRLGREKKTVSLQDGTEWSRDAIEITQDVQGPRRAPP